jgi:hypothetical protein
MRRTTHGARQQVRDFPLHHGVGFEAVRVRKQLRFRKAVQLGDGKRGVAAKELRDAQVAIPFDHRRQHPPPVLGTGFVAAPQQDAL